MYLKITSPVEDRGWAQEVEGYSRGALHWNFQPTLSTGCTSLLSKKGLWPQSCTNWQLGEKGKACCAHVVSGDRLQHITSSHLPSEACCLESSFRGASLVSPLLDIIQWHVCLKYAIFHLTCKLLLLPNQGSLGFSSLDFILTLPIWLCHSDSWFSPLHTEKMTGLHSYLLGSTLDKNQDRDSPGFMFSKSQG